MGFRESLRADHPLVRVYRMMVEAENRWDEQGTGIRRVPDAGGEGICIVKESHGLLAAEALLEALQCRMLLYASDPVFTVDRLLALRGEKTPYLADEGERVLDPRFIARYLRGGRHSVFRTYQRIVASTEPRQRMILGRVLTVALIQDMFHTLAARHPASVFLVESKALREDPDYLEFPLVGWLGETGLDIAARVIGNASFLPDGREGRVWRDSWPESLSGYEFISEQEADLCRGMLQESGFEESAPISLQGHAEHYKQA